MRCDVIFLTFSFVVHVFAAGLENCTQVGSKCLMLSTTKSNHPKAKQHCQDLGGTLVSIHNSIDNNAILEFASSLTSGIWLGLTCKTNGSPEMCAWDDESANDYSNWLPGYPVTSIGSCVYLDPPNQPLKGRWISATCELDQFYYLCE